MSGPGAAMPAMQWHPAPGKLNLMLHVLGRRADGMHRLQTVFRLIDRCDRVGIEARADGVLQRLGATAGVPPESDLCLRAAQALRARAVALGVPDAVRLGVTLALDKQLPVGGGLGGGSSDAATVLLVLNRLWAVGLTRAALLELGAGLGADVPFFLFGRNALGEGIGERLTPLALPPAWYLVLVPQVAVSTREIFSEPALTRDSKELKIPPFFRGLGRNDLEPVVRARHAAVAAHLDWLAQHARHARLTGSGGCVFAELDDEAGAQALHAKMPQAMQGFVARGLEHHPLQEWIPAQAAGKV